MIFDQFACQQPRLLKLRESRYNLSIPNRLDGKLSGRSILILLKKFAYLERKIKFFFEFILS